MTTTNSSNHRFRISPALVISCLALFVALAGSAVAAGLVGKNSVRSPQIVDGSIRNVDLHDGSINSAKIAEDGVEGSDLAPNSVGTSEVQDGSLSEQDLGAASVGSRQLQAGAVRATDLGPVTQVTNSTAIAVGGNAAVTVTCPPGTTVLSGGGEPGLYTVSLVGSVRNGNGWMALAHSDASKETTLTAYAYCLVGGSSN